ncbi:cytochrome c peroxidase [Pleionea sp. CnH1-48]|uniref:cytochrome-c peroxidase n=1 Tax=Pleionea sp. CnH1-48 TaxID=2954494 RepID=UPI002097BABB|nr:c-type cytochrome [Pleionea sp. CnH1-48]
MNLVSCLSLLILSTSSANATNQDAKIQLGKQLFFDVRLSEPAGQSCATCHQPQSGYATRDLNVTAGVIVTRFGNRNTPSITYSSFTPQWHYNDEDETWIGGFFWDGRALTLEEQAKGPFLNPVEMANESPTQVVSKVRRYHGTHFEKIYGADIWKDTSRAFDAIANALAAFQSSEAFAPRFSSKYDAYLKGKVQLSALEQKGLELFEDEKKGNCAACHPSQQEPNSPPPLFTDFSYDNLGTPKTWDLPFYKVDKAFNPDGPNYIDEGLALNPRIKNPAAQKGKFKVPTLRNIAITAPYMHNGALITLKDVVDFYNKRDVDKHIGKQPEVAENINTEELGDLKLTDEEVVAIVAFMETLTDGWVPPPQLKRNK